MFRTTRFFRFLLAAGLAAGALVPASTALALTPPAPQPIGPGAIAIPDTTPDPGPGPQIPGDKTTVPNDCVPGRPCDDPGDGDRGDEPGNCLAAPCDDPGDGDRGDEPGDGDRGDEPGDDEPGDDEPETEVESDTVVAQPNFTG